MARKTPTAGSNIRERSSTDGGLPRFEVRWRDSNDNHRQRSFRTLEAAEKFAAQRKADALHDRVQDEDKAAHPFTFYADRLVEAKPGHVRARMVAEYRDLLDRYAVPYFGKTPVGRITKAMCGDYVRHLSDIRSATGYGLAPATIRHAYLPVMQVLELAASDDAIPSNPAALSRAGGAGIKLPTRNAAPRPNTFEPHPLTAEEVNDLCCALDERDPTGMDSMVVCFLANTGLRAAELSGLDIGDYNPLRSQITVARTRTKLNGIWVTGEPKTKRSSRTIPVPDFIKEELDAYLLTHPRRTDPTAPLFPGRKPSEQTRNHRDNLALAFDWSKPLEPTTFLKRRMRPALLAAGLPLARLHDLRHSYGTNLYLAGEPISKISKLLGHSTTTVTETIYVHDTPSGYHDVVASLQNPRTARQRPSPVSALA